jgi:hypothetical protein
VLDVFEPYHQPAALRVKEALMRLLNGLTPLGDVNSIVAARIPFAGNTISDTQEWRLSQARGGEVLGHLRLGVQGYGLGSRHPPSLMCSPGATRRSSSDSSARAPLPERARTLTSYGDVHDPVARPLLT